MRRPWTLPLLAALLAAPATARAQTPASPSAAQLVAEGDAAHDARELDQALERYRAALALDSLDYAANWRAARTLIDLGKQVPDTAKDKARLARRDSLYAEAARLARRATEVNPQGADGHFVLAFGLGRVALARSPKERVRLAREIREEALTAIGLDQFHDGAYHVLGRWNAEIMRLPGFQRFVAKQFLGAKVFNEASWDDAVKYLERAVELRPAWIYHRLDLAEVLVDRKRYAEARAQLEAIAPLPIADASDPEYKARAETLLGELDGRR